MRALIAMVLALGTWLPDLPAHAQPAPAASAQPAPAASAQPAAPSLAPPPWLGAAFMDGQLGVRVLEVIADTPADRAGLLPGDQVVTIDDARTATFPDLKAAITSRRVGETITLSVWRDGHMLQMSTVLDGQISASEILSRRLVGKSAPNASLVPLDSLIERDLRYLQNDVTVLYFFSLGCRECDRMNERLSRLTDAHRRDGLEVIAISRDGRSDLQSLVKRIKPSFQVLQDMAGEATRLYRIEGTPAIVVIAPSGEIAYAGMGLVDNLDRAVFATLRELRGRRQALWLR